MNVAQIHRNGPDTPANRWAALLALDNRQDQTGIETDAMLAERNAIYSSMSAQEQREYVAHLEATAQGKTSEAEALQREKNRRFPESANGGAA